MTDGGSSIPEVHALLATLVASKPAGRFAETGTARWQCRSCQVLRAEVVHGHWLDVLPQRAPFDLLFVGRTRNEAFVRDRYRFAQIDLAEARSVDALLASAFQDIADQRPSSVCLLNNAATIAPIGVIGQLAAAEVATARQAAEPLPSYANGPTI